MSIPDMSDDDDLPVSIQFLGAMYLVGQITRSVDLTPDQLKQIDNCLGTIYAIETGQRCDNEKLIALTSSDEFVNYTRRIQDLIRQREEEGILRKNK